jgi:UDP-glucuronate decarboxylase
MTCTYGVKNILDVALKHGARVVHASTSEVYGDPDVSPQTENYRGNVNCWGPRSNYDEGKRAAESFIYEYIKLGVDARVVRIFNTYGPNMDPNDGRVVSNLLVQAIKDEPLTIYGDGSQTRSFCYVDDLIRGITSLANVDERPAGPINIGNPNEFTILDLAKKISTLTGRQLPIVNKPFPQDDPKQRRPDITLAKELLNWEPTIQLDEGLTKTYDYFRSVVGV